MYVRIHWKSFSGVSCLPMSYLCTDTELQRLTPPFRLQNTYNSNFSERTCEFTEIFSRVSCCPKSYFYRDTELQRLTPPFRLQNTYNSNFSERTCEFTESFSRVSCYPKSYLYRDTELQRLTERWGAGVETHFQEISWNLRPVVNGT